MKVINIKDLDRKILYLDRGEYLINGNRYSFQDYYNNKIEVEDLKELRKINTTTITTGYYDEIKQKEISVEEYENSKKELLNKSYEDDDGYISFDNLDDEYKYKKFIKNHKAIQKTIESISDNIELAEETVIYKTENEYIESCYFHEKESEPLLYKYNREKAYLDIVKNKFNQLGFEFAGDCNYSQTKDKKIWGNSNHSGIRYVRAFGTYIFNDGFKLYTPIIRGTLEDMLSTYKKDKERIEDIIQRKYNENFATLNKDKLNRIPELMNELQYNFKKINSKKNTMFYYDICYKKIEEIQALINESFKQEGGKQ